MAAASKPDLFEDLMLPHLDAAYNLARWLTRNDDDARDVVQEAYLRALRFFDGFRGGDARPWLMAVVRNTASTWRRRGTALAQVSFDEDIHGRTSGAPTIETEMVKSSDRAHVRNCLESLPPEFREAMVMRELEDMSYKDIAEVSGAPIGTVMSRLARARRRLQDCLTAKAKGAAQ